MAPKKGVLAQNLKIASRSRRRIAPSSRLGSAVSRSRLPLPFKRSSSTHTKITGGRPTWSVLAPAWSFDEMRLLFVILHVRNILSPGSNHRPAVQTKVNRGVRRSCQAHVPLSAFLEILHACNVFTVGVPVTRSQSGNCGNLFKFFSYYPHVALPLHCVVNQLLTFYSSPASSLSDRPGVYMPEIRILGSSGAPSSAVASNNGSKRLGLPRR